MKYLAAYALCWLGGNKDPSPADLKSVLSSIGAEFEGSEAEFVCKNLNGKSLDEIVEEGSKRLQAFGGFVSAQGSSAQAAAAEEETAAAEVVEEEVEDAMEGGMDLFGGDDDW